MIITGASFFGPVLPSVAYSTDVTYKTARADWRLENRTDTCQCYKLLMAKKFVN